MLLAPAPSHPQLIASRGLSAPGKALPGPKGAAKGPFPKAPRWLWTVLSMRLSPAALLLARRDAGGALGRGKSGKEGQTPSNQLSSVGNCERTAVPLERSSQLGPRSQWKVPDSHSAGIWPGVGSHGPTQCEPHWAEPSPGKTPSKSSDGTELQGWGLSDTAGARAVRHALLSHASPCPLSEPRSCLRRCHSFVF